MGKRKKYDANKKKRRSDKRKSKQVKYKDTLFRMIFGKNKEALLSLYNALNHTEYDDPEQLEINTLEDAIYMGMRNDVSFILSDILNLYEHQASVNPNMPLRFLRYLSDIYKDYIEDKKGRIYSSALVPLPTPKFVVFYNGINKQEERVQYRLSDAYIQKFDEYQLELKVDVYNINPENNEDLKRACKLLDDYSKFVDLVNTKYEESKNIRQSLKEAVDECIMNDVLREFLIAHKAEVLDMDWLYEFDREEYDESIYKDGFEDGKRTGYKDGERIGIEAGKKLGIEELIENAVKSGRTHKEIAEFLNIPIKE